MTTTQTDSAALATALRRVPTQARSQQKVERAIAAAHALLAREGVDAVTLPRVADEAGVSVGALYQYLPDREAVVTALSAVYHARHEARLDELIAAAAAGPPEDPVGTVLDAVARVYREQAGTRALRATLQTLAHLDRARAHKERMVAKVHRLLTVVGLVEADAPDLVARTVFFAADGAMHEAFAADARGDRALLDELTTMLRAYLAPERT
ncbi:TetR/AcrR family transcriptional regulator [Nocardioides sp. YIM 152588]|uniref:TetR/AcrR family transcriptional regulator n=1 Tax=Nocardioides sp. YIM 152588 TaxID=3158259 RepID=UPI0032E4631B